jgi:hypothetical protein
MELARVGCAVAAALACGSASAQVPLFERVGDTTSDQFGAAVAFVGDVDADGFEDFAAGAPLADVPSSNAGMLRVFSGRTLLALHTWRGTASNQRFGTAVAGAGDLDGDAHDDVLVGAPGLGGYVQAISGASGAVLYALVVGPGANDFGRSVAGGGLVDGDSVPDVLVGEPYEPGSGFIRGRVHVFSGASGSPIRTHDGGSDDELFGFSVAFIGDADGDGRDEYVAGAPGYCSFGSCYVSAFDGATGAGLWNDFNAASWDQYGFSVARISDLTGDGVDDVLAGAMQDGGIGCVGNGKGFVRALDGTSGAQIFQVDGTAFYTGLGWSLAALGDLDGNGYEDFASGQPGTEGCGTGLQGVRVFDGQSGAAIATLPVVTGNGSQFGSALASGDANGDGLRDLVVGAPCSDLNSSNSGSLHAYTIVRSVESYCESESNSLGCTAAIAGVGTPSATLASPFDVRAINVLNNKSGLLFYGFKPRQTPFQGGHMCVVAPTLRTPIQSSGGSLPPIDDCTGVLTLDFNARIQSGVDPLLVAGEEVFAQFWSRDPPDASTTNLTNALAFYIQP